jgi:hypothetical protein
LQVTGAYHSSVDTDTYLLESFKRIFQVKEDGVDYPPWSGLQRYPALVLMYGMGLAAIASGDYRLLAELFTIKLRSEQFAEPEAVASALHHWAVLPNQRGALPGRERHRTPLCAHLEEKLRDPLRGFIPDDSEYQETFDWFEYILALVYVDLHNPSLDSLRASADGKEVDAWGPIGCFGWRQRDRDRGLLAETELREGQLAPDKIAKAWQAGLFGGGNPTGYAKFRAVKSAFDRFCKEATICWL